MTATKPPADALTVYVLDHHGSDGDLGGAYPVAGTPTFAYEQARQMAERGAGAHVVVAPLVPTAALVAGLRQLADLLEEGYYYSPATADVWKWEREYCGTGDPTKYPPGYLPAPPEDVIR